MGWSFLSHLDGDTGDFYCSSIFMGYLWIWWVELNFNDVVDASQTTLWCQRSASRLVTAGAALYAFLDAPKFVHLVAENGGFAYMFLGEHPFGQWDLIHLAGHQPDSAGRLKWLLSGNGSWHCGNATMPITSNFSIPRPFDHLPYFCWWR